MSFSFSLVWTINGDCVLSVITSSAAHCLNYMYAISWFLILALLGFGFLFSVCGLFWFGFVFNFCLVFAWRFFEFCFSLLFTVTKNKKFFKRLLSTYSWMLQEWALSFLLGGVHLHYWLVFYIAFYLLKYVLIWTYTATQYFLHPI